MNNIRVNWNLGNIKNKWNIFKNITTKYIIPGEGQYAIKSIIAGN